MGLAGAPADPAETIRNGRFQVCMTNRVGSRQLFVFPPKGLLIVAVLFFIHRGDGEVAEWSKALPC